MSAMPILLVSKESLAVQDEGEGDGRSTPLSFPPMEKETLVPLHHPSVQ
jgi:hypothetical protein